MKIHPKDPQPTPPPNSLVMADDCIQVPIDRLKPYGRKARTHSDKQILKLAQAFETFGMIVPIIIDEDYNVLAGDARVRAAKKLGLPDIPAIQVRHLTPEKKKAFILAENRLAELAGWDKEVLAIELRELEALDLDFDLGVIGFETAEIDLLIGDAATAANEEAENDIPEPAAQTVSRLGDLWLMNDHKLLCGNALDDTAYGQLFDDACAAMVFSDPPYNVPISGHVCGKGRIQHGEFAMASGEMSPAEFHQFLKDFLSRIRQHTRDGAVLDVCMDWRHIDVLLAAGKETGLTLINLCVWNKDNGGMGSLYRSKHELVAIFRNGTTPHTNNVDLGRYGRNRTNVWDYAGVNSMRKGRLEDLAMHPTVKPLQLVADAILDVTDRRDIVLDPFSGSGTTIMAAEKTARAGYGIELDPAYVDVTLRRFERLYGVEAIHAETGKTFSKVALDRAQEPPPPNSPEPAALGAEGRV